MAPPKVVHGARAIVRLAGAGGQAGQPVGTFSSFSYGINYDVQPVFLLGRHGPVELVYTGMEPIRCNAQGWRVMTQGPHVQGKIPKLQDLLTHEYIQIDILDRQTGLRMAIVRDIRPETYAITVSNRQLTEISYSFVALRVDDESATNNESPGAADLPPVG